ncbi:GGDEF domain-containing protein [Mycobacterium pinniadriaticum]|uniref:GGDEF domain-containing protein n=2 Tax=Mycobacterium pinniadriaticum TaxID=2994102 RepID=A0ABT3SJM0_9MYCO|nr:GGDEF domain-containing protein [Mycobacterium pinniadriaticum]MCX2939324.1 GGDEF domain-containing protein [Mycobacterium pinniadriaticum]
MAASVRQWWRRPDQYDTVSAYLESRGLQRPTRYTIAAVMGAFALVPPIMLASPSGPKGTVAVAVSVGTTAACAVLALLWAIRWPTERQSTVFTVTATACIVAGGLIATDPAAGVFGGMAFAPLAGYLSFFHSGRLSTALLAAASVSTVVVSFRVAPGDPMMAIGHSIGALATMVMVPLVVQALLHMLTADAHRSFTDPLTGLRNRRGYYQSAIQLIGAADRSQPQWLTVIMVDLDGFKQINDRHGHGYGDAVLVAVADNLRRASAMNSVVARPGGEEFLLAYLAGSGDPAAGAERIREAVAATPGGVTASVGVAVRELADIDGDAVPATITRLVDEADAAMYDAKRAGGNQVRYRADVR